MANWHLIFLNLLIFICCREASRLLLSEAVEDTEPEEDFALVCSGLKFQIPASELRVKNTEYNIKAKSPA
jgi:hypothetical protein